MKKHYLFLMKTNQLYGAERRMLSIFARVDYSRFSITLAVCERDIFLPYLKDNKLPINLINLPSHTETTGILHKFLRFYNFFREIRPDVIVFSQYHLTSFSMPELLAGFLVTNKNNYMIAHDSGRPYEKYRGKMHFGIIPGLGLQWRTERLFQKKLFYLTRNTLAVSKGVKYALIKCFKYPKDKIKIFYHGVDVKKYYPDLNMRNIMRKEMKIPPNATVIISTARLAKEKCIDRLINAFDALPKEFDNTYLLIAGDGPLRNNLESTVNQKMSQKRIKFLGYQENLSPYLKASDIYVLPSDIEGFGNALLEAMSTGLICIATKTAGPSEIIKYMMNGFLVEKSQQGVLDGLTKSLLLKEDERKQFSYNTRKFIEENFNIDNRVKEELDILGLN